MNRVRPLRILIVAPHPDDEVLGCGATAARLASQGHELHVAIVTRGWAPLFSDAQVAQVRGEAARAAARLGVRQVHHMDLPVTRLALLPEHEINLAFNRLIDEVRPHWVFLPHRGDVHEDHKQVYDAALVALRPTGERVEVERILCYETLSETHWHGPGVEAAFVPQVFFDVSGHLADKLDAMRLYASQVRPAPSARSLESVEALARFRGMTVHCAAAEAFVLIRETHRATA